MNVSPSQASHNQLSVPLILQSPDNSSPLQRHFTPGDKKGKSSPIKSLSEEYLTLEDNEKYEPYYLEDSTVDFSAELQPLTRFSYERIALSKDASEGSDSHVLHYRSQDAHTIITERSYQRGHVYAIAFEGNDSAFIVPHDSFTNVQSCPTRMRSDDSNQTSTLERQQQQPCQKQQQQSRISISFWIVLNWASGLDQITFAEVPRTSVICFPDAGLFFTGAGLLDLPLSSTTKGVRRFSRAIISYFRCLEQLHIFGDKKVCKAMRHLLDDESAKSLPSNMTSFQVAADVQTTANFEIFVLGMLDLGLTFGMTDLCSKKLSFMSMTPSIHDLEIFVSKTRFMENLVELQLISMSLCADGAAVIAKMLSSNFCKLSYLSMTRNPLNDLGCTCICESLAGNTSLTKLSLGDVNATSISAHHISTLLLFNSTLETLSLYENPIEKDGFVSIFNSLQQNSSLTSLSFQDCPKFDPACATKLVRLLQVNTRLIHVGLSGNKIGRELDQEIQFMIQANQKLKAKSNWYPQNSMLKFVYMGGITKTMSGLELYSNIADEVTILILANNSFDETSVRKLCAVLHGFSNLQQLFLDNNPIGSKGLVLLGGFVDQTTVLKELSLTNCSVEFLPRDFVSVVSKLTTCSLEENCLIPWPATEVLVRSENAHDIHELFYKPIDNVSRGSWVLIQEYLSHRCTEDGLKMLLSLIQFNGNGCNFCTSDCARLWIMIVGIPFETETLYEVIEGFIELNVHAWSTLAFCADDYGREAIMLSVGATQQFLSSRCFFMGLYDIPDGTQYEYKSATCTVYIVDRVENNKRTRVALKFMKNEIEFQREQASRSIFLASSCTQAHQSNNFIIDVIANYDSMNSNLQIALKKRRWLVDYDNPCLLVMPAADRNLRIIMDNERITNPAVIKEMFRQTLACVKFVHENGYIHGDLKPRNIVRILRCLKLIDFDASAQICQQYAWTKHSSAYLPPEAVRLSLDVKCDDLDVAKNASSLTQCTILFKVTLPIDISIGCTLEIVLDNVYLTTVHRAVLDTAVDLSSHARIDNYVIALTVDGDVAAGAHSIAIVATFEGNFTAVDSTNATIQLIMSSICNQMTHSQSLQNLTSSIRIPVVRHAPGKTVPQVLCSCENFVTSKLRSVDRSIPFGCIGLCGVAHISHDMWALGVILYRFCARQSLFVEDDEDNIKDGSVSGHLLELAQWTDDIKEMRLQNIDDTITRALISKLLEKHPWKRPRSVEDVLHIPFNEMDIIRLKLEQLAPQQDSHSSNLVGCVKDLSTGKFKDAAYGLRTYLKVASNWDEGAACTLQCMQDEVNAIKDCPNCAQIQAAVLQRLGLIEAAPTLKLALALFDLKLDRGSATAADVVQKLRTEISKAGGWHYGMPNSIVWPDDSVKVDCGDFSKVFSQPMCEACKNYDLDYSKIASDLHYIIYESAVEKKEWNGIRDHGRAGYRLKDFMALPQAAMAMLTEAELVAMRFYTSHSFNSINIAMRDTGRKVSHPLPGIVTNIERGLKKLRALGSDNLMSKRVIVLWRGMSSMQIPQQSEIEGGTELAPMSTTADVGVAISYAVKKDVKSALLFRIVTRNNLERGADVQWLSMFPDESEILFPPLTYLQRTRTQLQNTAHNGVTVTVVELSATLA